MSMFDYDARPVTPGVVLVGTPASRGGYAIRDFLSRNGYPFEWVDAGQPDAVRAVLGVAEVELSALPLCILPDGSRLAPATVEQVATGLGMVAAPSRSEYDLTIVGAGPAGLAAAVNAASEGLRTVVAEAVAPGGQAGTTSMIENYLGFPNGISGSELATRATVQARRFGAELLLARPLVDVSADGPGYVAELSDGTPIRGRAVLFASGVEWRRLDVPGVDDLLGAGVYYGAGPSEALACTDSQVVVVGGGNSAGQAVVRFSRYAQHVTLLVRGHDLGASMSQYLIDQVSAIPNVDVRVRTQVAAPGGGDRLRAVIVRSGDSTNRCRCRRMRRIYEYCYPLEDARARRAYGVPSGVNNILIINKAVTPGRSNRRSSSRSARLLITGSWAPGRLRIRRLSASSVSLMLRGMRAGRLIRPARPAGWAGRSRRGGRRR